MSDIIDTQVFLSWLTSLNRIISSCIDLVKDSVGRGGGNRKYPG